MFPQAQQTQGPNLSYLQGLFQSVDKDRNGAIDAVELQTALSNGTSRAFNADTGTFNFDEFVSAWTYITSWLNHFNAFDKDGSGSIDRQEFRGALTQFGYRLSGPTVDFMVTSPSPGELHYRALPTRPGCLDPLTDTLHPLPATYSDILAHYHHTRREYPPPHPALTNEESRIWRPVSPITALAATPQTQAPTSYSSAHTTPPDSPHLTSSDLQDQQNRPACAFTRLPMGRRVTAELSVAAATFGGGATNR
ncbi:hypothetical protein HPB48_016487 [Haemaphysalis longicornis]|uniref:EF-hand domain-containing protein n=1 Tax=Haemaphysalis longicornis TaxID=44386 RepID=A0A9J6FW15_HAELO|nr:hypothetical protein HPB48_016487 [Haemaphysalis longicornis]